MRKKEVTAVSSITRTLLTVICNDGLRRPRILQIIHTVNEFKVIILLVYLDIVYQKQMNGPDAIPMHPVIMIMNQCA